MLTMRPLRAFIMPRKTALDRRNTEARLVSRTASQSSSFMRNSKVSRVMPALLQRMPITPSFASMSSSAASIESGLTTSRTTPRPPCAARLALIRAAPSAVVAVPMTRAPSRARRSAMAAPMPRVAPVTKAISPFSIRPPLVLAHRGRPRRERIVQAQWILQRHHLEVAVLVHSPVQARQYLARTAFHDLGRARRDHRAHRRRPIHRRIQLFDKPGANAFRGGMRFDIDTIHGDPRRRSEY